MTTNLPDPDTLRVLYDDEGKTVREIAALARCRPQTILAAMEAAGIPRRRCGRRRTPLPEIDPETLAEIARWAGAPAPEPSPGAWASIARSSIC